MPIHGASIDLRRSEPQVAHPAPRHRVLRSDRRGHGRTGGGAAAAAPIALVDGAPTALLDAIGRVILGGSSLGAIVAQAFAVAHPERSRALILDGTAVSTSLSWGDRLQRDVLFPEWLMRATIRSLGARRFVRCSFWLAWATRSGD